MLESLTVCYAALCALCSYKPLFPSDGSAPEPGSLMVCPCGHVYCTDCLRAWMLQKLECPSCRAVLPLEVTDDMEP